MQAVRRVDSALRAFKHDLSHASLVVTGNGRKLEVYVRDRGELLALLEAPGLAIATLLDLGRATAEVREATAAAEPKRQRRGRAVVKTTA